ncbi:hypothetical protein ABF228_002295 [Yersinia ruckeri]|nr:hypothetical protein [Yersinia ruckeri]
MDILKVPFGLDTYGNLVSVDNIVKGQSYFCPACSTQLVYKSGEIRAKHFSHPAESGCSPESILHKTAKRLIKNVIISNSNETNEIELVNYCRSCGDEYVVRLKKGFFSGAEEEVSIPPYICDIVGFKNNEMRLAIEIFVTNEVNSEKAKGLKLFWIELDAQSVINNPYYWRPKKSRLKDGFCDSCNIEIKHIQTVADHYSINRDLYSPISDSRVFYYIAGVEVCFKCKNEIPVFWWPGVPFSSDEPLLPRPHTIKLIFSKKFHGSYWANTCAYCNSTQGDNYLFILNGAIFGKFPLCYENIPNNNNIETQTSNSISTVMKRLIDKNIGWLDD